MTSDTSTALSSEAQLDPCPDASMTRRAGDDEAPAALKSRRVSFGTHVEERTEASAPGEFKFVKMAKPDALAMDEQGQQGEDTPRQDAFRSSPHIDDSEELPSESHQRFAHAMQVLVTAITPSSPSNWLLVGTYVRAVCHDDELRVCCKAKGTALGVS